MREAESFSCGKEIKDKKGRFASLSLHARKIYIDYI